MLVAIRMDIEFLVHSWKELLLRSESERIVTPCNNVDKSQNCKPVTKNIKYNFMFVKKKKKKSAMIQVKKNEYF